MNPFKQLFTGKPAVFIHAERDLAIQCGLGHEHVKPLRGEHLKRGTDWELVKGVICYSDHGVRKLKLLLKISGDLPAPPRGRRLALESGAEIEVSDGVGLFIGGADSAPNSARGLLTEEDILNATKIIFQPVGFPSSQKKYVEPEAGEVRELRCEQIVKNRKILRASDGGREAWIRVRDSKKFRAGMTVRAEFVAGAIWDFIGRLPRWPGKY